ncbi:MAG TPA: multiheme c-type cytochrome [Vicinamibacterales bacterium]|jgi:hypothetical protein|nr:multiheme c-type cytochrome [Vicinamibacterales bacterium]
MKLAITLVAMALLAAGGTRDEPARAQQGAGPDVANYAWDGACKDCHTDVYESWAKTKHATALNRLTASERQQECVGCHVTGADRLIDVGGQPANSNVQCESCHGPGRAHVESAKTGGPGKGNIVRKPTSAACERCHNKKSPHFKGFFYDAMLGFVHRTKGPA